MPGGEGPGTADPRLSCPAPRRERCPLRPRRLPGDGPCQDGLSTWGIELLRTVRAYQRALALGIRSWVA
ncbi:hypothetical protein GCM10010495_42140 [Kitasatospora herbaricolor]|nr:hypothetical protein GCM10010495_42140 [Kitasatospora herbaricolor]